MSQIQSNIKPCLWYDNQAKEAAEFYCSIFPNSKIISASNLLVDFELNGMPFAGLNGGPKFKFNESVSFQVFCEDQAEVDHLWDSLTADGGAESMCSWCKDKYGLSWQIIPKRFIEMMSTGTPEQVQRVTEAMLKMRKLIIADFEKVFNQN